MADKHDQWTDTLSAGHSGWLTGFLAEEDKLDSRMLWRLGSWGVVAVGAVVVAILASQSQVQLRREQVATSDMLARQAQQLQFVTKETQTEARRLSSAIDTLNGDRDRLFARVTSMEQGLEAVTGSIKRQSQTSPTSSAAPAPVPSPAANAATPPASNVPPAAPQAATDLPTIPSAPLIGPVASTAPVEPPAAKSNVIAPTLSPVPLAAAKSMVAPPDAAAAKLSEPAKLTEPPAATPAIVAAEPAVAPADAAPAALPPAPETTAAVQTASAEPTAVIATPVARTEFGVDIGGANSVDGLRAIWRGMSKSHLMAGLRPIITVKERSTGLGMQLRLVAGPFNDAAAAAKTCAAMIEGKRPCETTVFEGQRLALKADAPPPQPTSQATSTSQVQSAPLPKLVPHQATRKRPVPNAPKPQERTEQAPPPKPVEEAAPPPKPQSSLTSLLGLNREQ